MIVINKSGYLKYKNLELKCTLGKAGVGIKKREGDNITPKGTYKILNIYYRKDRINPIQYCEWVSKSFDDIYKSSPVIKIPDKKLDISIQIAQEMSSFKSKDPKPIQEKDKPISLVMPETPSNKSIESKITSNFLEDITKLSIVIPDDTPSNFQEVISKTPEDILVNTYTDKMMEYEMKRMKL